MKINEIRELKTPEIMKKVSELKEELFTIKFQQATGKIEGASKASNIKKDIARMLTVVNERAKKGE